MNYETLLKKIEKFTEKYNVKVIGKTILGRNIFAVEKVINKNFFTAIFIASVHAREHITTDLLCKMLDDGLFDEIRQFNISFILMANPDGVELCINGLKSLPRDKISGLLTINKGSQDFSLWKANVRGVDINNNFDAHFGTNVHSVVPASSGYVGEFAESENETQAVVNYTKSLKVFFTISYHSKGEELYFNFFQTGGNLLRDSFIAKRFALSTGYKIKNVETFSSGGYKDFCVQKLKIPAITLEIGSDQLKHPISDKFLDEIYLKHKTVAKDLLFAYNVFMEFENK